jgi:HPt (histidine-containing phosphotransfer) domain-containing protein
VLNRLTSDTGGAPDLVGLFREDSKRELAQVADALRDRDAQAVARAAHALKGSSGQLGAARTESIAAQLQAVAETGELGSAKALLRRLETAVDAPSPRSRARCRRRTARSSLWAMWLQREISLRPPGRGFYLITREVVGELPELGELRVGLLHLFMLHTSASLTLNENASPDVRRDFEAYFNEAVPRTRRTGPTPTRAPTTCPRTSSRRCSGRPCPCRSPTAGSRSDVAGDLPVRAPRPAQRAARAGDALGRES